MAFGKRKSDDSGDSSDEDTSAPATDSGELDGPFDIEDFDDPSVATVGRLDLGSVLIPLPEAGQVQVELTQQGVPSAVWVVTPNGRFTVAAYAAPKTAGPVARSRRPNWPTRCARTPPRCRSRTAHGAARSSARRRRTGTGRRRAVHRRRRLSLDDPLRRQRPSGERDALAKEARNALADTVVRRGETPLPVRTPLPVELPEPMANQLRAAAAQAARPAGRPTASSRHRRSLPRAAASRGRPCSSCGPSPAASIRRGMR